MKNLLLDRDGVLIEERAYDYTPENIRLLPGVAEGLRMLASWRFFVISNQSGVGRGHYTAADVKACNARLLELLHAEGVTIQDCVFCPHHPDDHCACRKPKTGMMDVLADRHGLRMEDCVMVGNRDHDIAFARAVGCRAVRVLEGVHPLTAYPDICVRTLPELADILLGTYRKRILSMSQVTAFAEKERKEGRRIVTTNGAFDLLHGGHEFLLQEARKYGDILLVGVNADASVRQKKGEGRPIESETIRAQKVARYADAVFIFEDSDPRRWLTLIRPHVHLNAASYGQNCVEAPVLRAIGAQLVLVSVQPELGSTTAVLASRTPIS